MSKIVLWGKRIRKPRDVISTEKLPKHSYGFGTRCFIEERESIFVVDGISVKSLLNLIVYETRNTWSDSSDGRQVPLGSIEEAKMYLQDNFGGMWKFEDVIDRRLNLIGEETWGDVYDKFYNRLKELCKIVGNDINIPERHLYINIKSKLIVSLNIMMNYSHDKKYKEQTMSEYAYLVRRYILDLENFLGIYNKKYKDILKDEKRSNK